MARPIKKGLDYFPLDVLMDDSIELLEAECGLQGFAILIKLWQKIYSNGYFIMWSEDNKLLFSRRINSDINEVNSVINACFKRNLLDKTLYEKHEILTSEGIQKRYLRIVNEFKRKKISVISDYLLVDSELIGVNTELTTINESDKYGKERKGKERKGNINKSSICEESKDDSHEHQKNCKSNPKPMIKFSVDSFEIECVNYLVEKILEVNPKARVPDSLLKKQKWALYIDRLRRIDHKEEDEIKRVLKFSHEDKFWKSNILSTSKFREKYDTLFAQMFGQNTKNSNKTTNQFNNYSQRDVDIEALEKRAFEQRIQESASIVKEVNHDQ